jgi:hypothetical protein
MSTTTHHPEDRRAAYMGLIIGAVALFVIVVSIVKVTNARFASHERPAAEAAK